MTSDDTEDIGRNAALLGTRLVLGSYPAVHGSQKPFGAFGAFGGSGLDLTRPAISS